jgi:hypothetical protein
MMPSPLAVDRFSSDPPKKAVAVATLDLVSAHSRKKSTMGHHWMDLSPLMSCYEKTLGCHRLPPWLGICQRR